MSKIEELIKNEKVEWKKLGEVCEIKRGRVISKAYLEQNSGAFPVYSSQTRNNGEIGRINTYDFNGEYATWTTDGAYAGTVFYRDGKFSITNICGLIKPNDSKRLLVKYIVYWLQIEANKHVKGGSGNPKLMSNVVANIQIPIPPLEVQREIVRILDSFTLLIAELKTELTARKKQYEYYRDELLRRKTVETEEVLLEDIATYSKERIPANEVDEYSYVGVDNLLQEKRGKTVSSHVPTDGNLTKYYPGDILIGNIRPYLRKIWFADNIGGTNGDVLVIHVISDKVLPQYLYYNLSSERFFEYDTAKSKGAKMPRGDKNAVMKYNLLLPPIATQKRIVDVLNNFEKICNDLSSGLPAEIEARQKQYEYYRQKLLNFK